MNPQNIPILGYALKDSVHCLLEEPSRGIYFMAAIPNTNEASLDLSRL